MTDAGKPEDDFSAIYLAVGVAITRWQLVEGALTQLFIVLLRAKANAASAAFNSVLSFRTKVDMVRKAAVVQLKDTLLDECMSLCKRLDKKANKRNQLAHFMVVQDAPQDKPLDIKQYLTPTVFDAARRLRRKGKPPMLDAKDIRQRAKGFDDLSRQVLEFSEKVKKALAPQAD